MQKLPTAKETPSPVHSKFFADTYASSTIDKRNQQLKNEIWDVNTQFETDTKVVGSNPVPSIFLITM
jgi:hypothetical protein